VASREDCGGQQQPRKRVSVALRFCPDERFGDDEPLATGGLVVDIPVRDLRPDMSCSVAVPICHIADLNEAAGAADAFACD
jgi:hypothetical protein